MIDPTKPTVQVVQLVTKLTRPRDNTAPQRGDFPELRRIGNTPVEVAKSLMDAYNTNRLANEVLVILPDGKQYTYLNKEFQTRIQVHIGSASAPSATVEGWLERFTAPFPQPNTTSP